MRIIESMFKVCLPNGMTIRVWRNETELRSTYDNNDINIVANLNTHLQLHEMAELVCKLPRVNAVEVLDAYGDGVLIYPDWP